MEDTSLVIHPGNNYETISRNFIDIGKLLSFEKSKTGILLNCENSEINLCFYREDIVRITMNPIGKPSLRTSPAVIKEQELVNTTVEEQENELVINSSKFIIKIVKSPCRFQLLDHKGELMVEEDELGLGFNNQNNVICYKKMHEDDHYYGFGEKTGFLDKRGETYTMWNSDVYAPHNPETDPLYQSIPFFMTLRHGKAYGIFFDNTFRTTFNMREDDDHYSFSAEGGQLDYYLLAGPKPKDVVEQYTCLTGRMPLPPKWAIGYHQSRYSYKDELEVREIVRSFKEKEIPLDAVYLDIHYMNEYRVFTFDKNRFPNPKKLIEDLKAAGIRIVPIVDPGVKADPEYTIYKEGTMKDMFCKYLENEIFFGDVWPGKSAFPDFSNEKVREWWGQKHQYYTDLGIEGIWNDMNEPSVFNESKTMDVKVVHHTDEGIQTHREFHNLYGLMMGKATHEGLKKLLNGKRPFLLTRAGYAGVQRYSTVWTGDNRSFWEHLEMAIPMVLNLGLSGVAFTGPDVGGFAYDSNGELLTRWTQLGAFTPYFRNHSSLDVIKQEPWSFGPKYEEIIKKYIQLRYKWLPYLYTLFKEASQTGVPVMRPLLMTYPEDEKTYRCNDQFLVGDNVMIAPIVRPGGTHRVVYFPEGNWYDYWTEEYISGGQYQMVEAPLEKLPIYIKEGTILPESNVISNTNRHPEQLTIHVYPSESWSNYVLYEDDGLSYDYESGSTFELEISCEKENAIIKIESKIVNDTFQHSWKNIAFQVHGVNRDTKIFLNNRPVLYEFNDHVIRFGL